MRISTSVLSLLVDILLQVTYWNKFNRKKGIEYVSLFLILLVQNQNIFLDRWSNFTRQNKAFMGTALFCNCESVFFDAGDTRILDIIIVNENCIYCRALFWIERSNARRIGNEGYWHC